MITRKHLAGLAAVALLGVGVLAAQNVRHASDAPGERMQRFQQFIANQLNLTAEQKQQAEAIFTEARQSARPIVDQLKQQREAITAAVKAGASDDELDKLATGTGPLVGRLAAVHVKAMAKFYAILTPEQQQKAGELHDTFRSMLPRHAAPDE